jgi:hypothetical protein
MKKKIIFCIKYKRKNCIKNDVLVIKEIDENEILIFQNERMRMNSNLKVDEFKNFSFLNYKENFNFPFF